jgi:hypothetical protein
VCLFGLAAYGFKFKFIETWPLADDVYTFHSIHDSSNVLCGVNDILFSLFCDNGY